MGSACSAAEQPAFRILSQGRGGCYVRNAEILVTPRVCLMAAVLLYGSPSRGEQAYHTYRSPELGMPVSLAVGRVETRPFHVRKTTYAIIIQFAKRLPVEEMACMAGETALPTGIWHCNAEQLLQADWIVRDENRRIVSQGVFDKRGLQCVFLNGFVLKYIGYFRGARNGTYTLEVTFRKDASPLNVCDPQLIVMRTGAMDYLD